MRRFVIGDIHGNSLALERLLLKAKFDFNNDLLISLGDIFDRGPDFYGCIGILNEIKNKICIAGNHDIAFYLYIRSKTSYHMFRGQHGSLNSIEQYDALTKKQKKEVLDFLIRQRKYYIDSENNLFVHGGFDNNYKITYQLDDIYYWDRTLIKKYLDVQNTETKIKTVEGFKNIFIGHTPTLNFYYSEEEKKYIEFSDYEPEPFPQCDKPMIIDNLVNLDTGKCFGGKLSLLNVDSFELFQE